MENRRLSKLQKRLLKLLLHGEEIKTGTLTKAIYGNGNIYELIGEHNIGCKEDFLSVQKSVLRSLNNLESKGMIINHRRYNGYKYSSQITDKGKSLIVEMISEASSKNKLEVENEK